MTGTVKVGPIGSGSSDQTHTDNFAFYIPEAELVAVADMFLETAKKYPADYLIPTIYNDHPSILTDNLFKTIPICFITNPHTQLTQEPCFTNSTSFPPFYCWEQERPPAPTIFI